MQRETMPLHLVLHSNQLGPHSRSADRSLLSSIPRTVANIGYVSSGPDPDRYFFNDRATYYSEIGAKLDFYVDETSYSGDALAKLQQCDAIHLSGGNTFTFLQWLRRSNLFDALTHFAKSGKPLIGVSAGAIMFTKSVASAALCGDFKPTDVVDEKGLSLVQFGFWPHFPAQSGAAITTCPLPETYETLYACPDGCAMVVNDMEVKLFGQVELLGRKS